MIRDAIEECNFSGNILKETDSEVLKATFENFFLNANIIGWPKQGPSDEGA